MRRAADMWSISLKRITYRRYPDTMSFSYQFTCVDIIVFQTLSCWTLYFYRIIFESINSTCFPTRRHSHFRFLRLSGISSFPVNLASQWTPHGAQQHHELIVYLPGIAIPGPYDRDSCKKHYHTKIPTNCGIKVQIADDYHHRIVHDMIVLRDSGLLEHVNNPVQIIADKEYIREGYVVAPRKDPRERE